MTAASAVGVLVAAGVYLILQRGMLRVILGFVLLGQAVNILVLASGGMDRRGLPFAGEGDPAEAADPLPQAFVLTAIVITFAVTVYLLALARAGGAGGVADFGDEEAGPDGGEGPVR